MFRAPQTATPSPIGTPPPRPLAERRPTRSCLCAGTTEANAASGTIRIASTSDEAFLEAVRRGDRAAIANFLLRYGPLIRMRIRERLGTTVRRVFDSEDLLSTLARRMDVLVATGGVHAVSPAQLWSLVMSIAAQAASEYARRAGVEWRHRELIRPPEHSTADVDASVEAIRGDEAARAVHLASAPWLDAQDREILHLHLRGIPHAEIAAVLQLTVEAVRMRWSRLLSRSQQRARRRSLGAE